MTSKLTPAACRAARGLLAWGIRELAANAGLSPTTVNDLEQGRDFTEKTADKIIAAFARHGVEITNGDGTGARLLLRRAKSKKAARKP